MEKFCKEPVPLFPNSRQTCTGLYCRRSVTFFSKVGKPTFIRSIHLIQGFIKILQNCELSVELNFKLAFVKCELARHWAINGSLVIRYDSTFGPSESISLWSCPNPWNQKNSGCDTPLCQRRLQWDDRALSNTRHSPTRPHFYNSNSFSHKCVKGTACANELQTAADQPGKCVIFCCLCNEFKIYWLYSRLE